LEAYYRLLVDPDPAVHMPAARVWFSHEEACSKLIPNSTTNLDAIDPKIIRNLARIEAHYMMHHGFLSANQILEQVHRVQHLPALIVQGRYDVVCPPKSAYELTEAWGAHARLMLIPDAGHSALELGICKALVDGLNTYAEYGALHAL
jgi:proline iminopeptidase